MYIFSIRKSFWKKPKKIEQQGRKQIDAIINQNEILASLNSKDDHKENYK